MSFVPFGINDIYPNFMIIGLKGRVVSDYSCRIEPFCLYQCYFLKYTQNQ